METTEYLGLKLPSRDEDDIADINVISEDFRKVEDKIQKNEEAIGERMTIAEAENTYEEKANKSTSMDMQSDVDYPTTKAVADFVKKKTSVLSNALYNSKKGAIISLNDISPIATDVDIQLENSVTPTTDFSDVNVKIGGKNLFVDFITDQTTSGGSTVTVNGDGSVTLDCKANDIISQKYEMGKLPPGTYTISNGLSYGTKPYVSAQFKSAKTGAIIKEAYTGETSFNKSVLTEETNVTLFLYGRSSEDKVVTMYPQLEVSETPTEYEQYLEIFELQPDSKGKLSFTTNFPSSTIFTDTDNVVVNAKYQRDINKAFEELQNAIISLGGNI